MSTTTARAVRTMNDGLITFPTAGPSTLSEDAHTVYRRMANSLSGQVDRDLLDRRSLHAYVSQSEAKKFVPTARMLAAFEELQDAGLGTWSPEHRHLRVTPVHPDYTVAFGRGSQLIEVRTFTEHPDYDACLLAVIVGGDITSTEGRRDITEVEVRARHLDATDFEHDSSSTALIEVKNPSAVSFGGYGRIDFTGVMTKPKLYALGVDPLAVTDDDTKPGMCTSCDDHHPFAAFLPPVLEGFDSPVFVKITSLPIGAYAVADLESTIRSKEVA